jgi:hypothetical protein
MSTRTKAFLDQCDEDFKQVLLRLYIERQPLHEFTKLLSEALENDQIVIVPMRRERRPEGHDQRLQDDDR